MKNNSETKSISSESNGKIKNFMKGIKDALRNAGDGFEDSNKHPEKIALDVIAFDQAKEISDNERRTKVDHRERKIPQLPE